jgi:uncharacterized membrane protein YbhN (UPF0104 family)
MIAVASRLIAVASRSRRARVALQMLVSLVLIVLLIGAAPHHSLAAAWEAVGVNTLLLACGCFALAAMANVRRWQILLRAQGIEEDAVRLTEVFFIGLFCSLFLPTAAGGDAYRVYEVSRRGRSTVRVLLATMQDRLLGLAGTMLVGMLAACYYYDLLSDNLFITVLAVYSLGILGVAGLLYLGHVLRLATQLMPASLTRWLAAKAGPRVVAFVEPLRHAPPLNWWRTSRVVGLALATFLFAVLMYAVVCDGLDAPCGFVALCLIVSLVGVVRMLPISLGGVGLGEEAFVVLTGLFGLADDKAVPVALTILGVSAFMSLLGGLLLLRRMFFGQQSNPTVAEPSEPAATILSLPARAVDQEDSRSQAA